MKLKEKLESVARPPPPPQKIEPSKMTKFTFSIKYIFPLLIKYSKNLWFLHVVFSTLSISTIILIVYSVMYLWYTMLYYTNPTVQYFHVWFLLAVLNC